MRPIPKSYHIIGSVRQQGLEYEPERRGAATFFTMNAKVHGVPTKPSPPHERETPV